jgi:hypothetical protein
MSRITWLRPIYDVLHQTLLQEKVLHGDETTLQVLREAGKAATSKSYMWLYRTSGCAEHPIVLYEYQPNRKAENAETFLRGFSGWLHADGYQGYHKLPENIRVVGCWAHARRKFDEALNALDKDARKGSLAATGESYCSRLFQLEMAFADLTPEERYTKRLGQEKPVLDALLTLPSELKVGLDYLVSDGLNKYSVPFDLIGEKVSLRLTKTLVEVFYRGSRVAVHTRERVRLREPVVKPEHMPPEHRKYLAYNESDFTAWAESIGENTKKVVRHFLTSGKETEQGFKACASVTKLADRYGPAQLEAACEYLLSFTATPSIRTLRTILKNGPTCGSRQTEPEKTERNKQHGITRGADYFRKGGASHD